MLAALLDRPRPISERPLQIRETPAPKLGPNQVLLKVRACGVCRTDLHISEGELPVLKPGVIPGHQIVGDVVDGASAEFPIGTRVGVSWIGGTDGVCRYCRTGQENLCDSPTFTGYTVNGGYAEYALARRDFVFPLPASLDDVHAAPLLCAGIIGFRSLRVAGVENGDRVGLFGFGASAHLVIAVLRAWNCKVYVSTRGESHRALASELGADWVGLGRLYCYGLAANGAAGIERVVELLEEEMKEVMGLLGVTSLKQLDKSYISQAMPTNLPGVHSAFPLMHEGY